MEILPPGKGTTQGAGGVGCCVCVTLMGLLQLILIRANLSAQSALVRGNELIAGNTQNTQWLLEMQLEVLKIHNIRIIKKE